MSYSAILRRVPVAKSTLSVWLNKLPLSQDRVLELRRAGWKKSKAKIELFRLAMREKRERQEQMIYEKYLKRFNNITKETAFVMGLMLYLAEGTKADAGKLVLTNTDPRICRFFIQWLKTFYQIDSTRVKIHLQLYTTMNIKRELNFWNGVLGVPIAQFYKPFIRPLTKSSFSYSKSFRHGTCAVIVIGVQIQREVMMAIRAYYGYIG